MLMICPKHKECLLDEEFCECGHHIEHDHNFQCDLVFCSNHCPNCVPVKEDNNEEEIICKPIDPNRSY